MGIRRESDRKGLDAMQAIGTAQAKSPRTRWVALAAVSLANFMAYLDNNVTNVAIPTIQRDLHLSTAGLEWIVSSYLLTLAGLLLVGGRLADVYGRRRVFLIGLVVFTLSSLTAGLADSGGMLIGARAVPTASMTSSPSGRNIYAVPVWRSYTLYMCVIADDGLYDV